MYLRFFDTFVALTIDREPLNRQCGPQDDRTFSVIYMGS